MVAEFWELPEVTAEALREGWLQTKEMATVDAAGCIYIVHRQADLMMSSGFSRYPRAVEEALSIYPAVREAGMFGMPDSE
jgi:acyl-CoA synthetase (AMP-forming)/AMP-acid ligase II